MINLSNYTCVKFQEGIIVMHEIFQDRKPLSFKKKFGREDHGFTVFLEETLYGYLLCLSYIRC